MSAEFGSVVRARRQVAGLTQRELAERAGVSLGALRDLEQGRTATPTVELMNRLNEVLPSGGGAETLRLQVFGQLAAWLGRTPIDLGEPQQQAVLAVLAVQPNATVSRQSIVDAVWGEHPPASAANLVQSYVGRLRRALDPCGSVRDRHGLIVSTGTGYRLLINEDQLDLAEFHRSVERARTDAEGAIAHYQRAMSLAEQEPLAGLDRLREHPALVRLRHDHTAALLEFGQLAIEAGEYDVVLPHLQTLAGREPLHERALAQLIIAFAGSGQQARALTEYDRVRRRLADQLGVRPGPELAAAHLRVLNEEVSPGTPPTGPSGRPAQLPAAVSDFTGRTEYLRRLTELAGAAGGPAVVITAIAGMAGVGKTALAVHWSRQMAGRYPDGQLYLNLNGYSDTPPLTPSQALEHLLCALGVAGDRIPDAEDARAGLYRTKMTGKRMLVVLDNANSAGQVRPLLPGESGCVVLVTSRDRLDGLVATDGARRFTLGVLNAAEATALLAKLLGTQRVAAESDAAHRLVELCARLPLAIRIAAANIDDQPITEYLSILDNDRLAALDIDGDPHSAVRAHFERSYRRLSSDERRAFRLLGLLPSPDVDVLAAAALIDRPVTTTRQILRRLVNTHLVEQHAAGRYAFHDLLRTYARDLARGDADGEAALRRLYNWYLHTAGLAVDKIWPTRRKPPRPLPAPTTPSTDFAGYDQAMAWLETERPGLVATIKDAAGRGWHVYSWQLPHTLMRYFYLRGHVHDWIEIHELALTAARDLHDPWAEAETLHNLAVGRGRAGRNAEAFGDLNDALALRRRLGDRYGEARTLNSLGVAHHMLAHYSAAIDCYEQSLPLFAEADDLDGQQSALTNAGLLHERLGNYERALECYERALRISRVLNQHTGVIVALNGLGSTHRRMGRHRRALECHQEALRTIPVGDKYDEADTLNYIGCALRELGRHADAIPQHRQAVSLATEAGDVFLEIEARNDFGETLHLGGEHVSALAQHERALALAAGNKHAYEQARAHHGLARALHATGGGETAEEHQRQALTIFSALGVPEADELDE